jgi:hypothetical protein
VSDTHAHVKPEPLEAAEPQPRRIYTLADHQARVAGWQHLAYRHKTVLSFAAWCEAVDVMDASRERSRMAAGEIR